jgi:hypothetical protein
MKKLILHIGSGKAGSTSLQQALSQSQEKNKMLYNYPILPNTLGNQIIRHAFWKDNSSRKTITGKNGFSKEVTLDKYQELIKASFREQCEQSDNIIVSSEFLFSSSENEIRDFGDFLGDIGFGEIHILIYLRDPAKYYLSLAQQALKKQYKIPQPNSFKYEMIGAIDKWSRITPTSMTIREFSILSLVNGDIVSDFESYLLGLGIAVSLDLDRRRNKSFSCEVTQSIQDVHEYFSNHEIDSQVKAVKLRKVRKLMRKGILTGTKPQIKGIIEEYIYKRFISEITEVYSRYGIFESIVKRKKIEGKVLDYTDSNHISLFRDIVENFDAVVYKKIKSKYMKLVV